MQPMRSVSQSKQPHKFFDRYLDNDLDQLISELVDRYQKIERAEVLGVTEVRDDEVWKSSNSVSTMKWREYNVFQFHIPGIRNLYDAVSDMVHEASEYYGIDFDQQQYMLQGWFNINYAKNGKLDWHDHGPWGAPNFHGYYSVSAEPSQTHYIAFDEYKINENKNNRAILSEMGHPHAMGDWDWEGPRITVAYDVVPLKDLISHGMTQEQHWVPLR
jgi:hypothetical protein